MEDLYDTRVPLHNEDAFTHGLKFKAKVSQKKALTHRCYVSVGLVSVGVPASESKESRITGTLWPAIWTHL